MHGKSILALVVASLMCVVDQCAGDNYCYYCKSTSEYGCSTVNREWRFVQCGSEAEIREEFFGPYEDGLIPMLVTLNRKQRYAKKTNNIKNNTQFQLLIDVIQVYINLKPPPPFYSDDVFNITDAKREIYNYYKALLDKWKEDDEDQYTLLWIETIAPKLSHLIVSWEGNQHMPKQPKWKNVTDFTKRVLEFDEYKEMMKDWIEAAEKTIAAGEYDASFPDDVIRKYSSEDFEPNEYYVRRRKRQISSNDGSFLQDLPVDKSWCSSFQGHLLGKRMGCGVHLEGFVFEEGCHEMSAPYKGITYCRCNENGCFEENGGARRSPRMLMLAVTFWAIVMA